MKWLFSQVVSAMHSFIPAMTLYSDVQKRAQAELGAFEACERLPFIEATVKKPSAGSVPRLIVGPCIVRILIVML